MNEDFGVDLDQVRAFLADKERRRRARIDERYAQATRDARTIVAEIAADVNPRRIYQWGSLLDRKRFSEISDLDIAVEGLNGPAEFFQVLGIAMNATALRSTSSSWRRSRRTSPNASASEVRWFMSEAIPELVALIRAHRQRLEVEYDWDRLDFLVTKLRQVHPLVTRDLERFVRFASALDQP